MRIAVVGAGIMGLNTALVLQERGHQVTLFEQHHPGNKFGSTAGRTRIVRQAYPDAFYTSLLKEGHRLWYDLQDQLGEQLIHEVGLLFLSPEEGEEFLECRASLDELEIPYEILRQPDVSQRGWNMTIAPNEVAVLTKEAGWADVPSVLGGLKRLCLLAGVEWVQKRVTDLETLSEFDKVVVTAGAWVKQFIDLPVKTTLQTYCYASHPYQGPVWIEGFGDHLYGFPIEPGTEVMKVGYHTPGPLTDPDSPTREPDPVALAAIQEGIRRRFGIPEPEIHEAGVCLYTVAPGDDFQIRWKNPVTLVASPCSGHGFKFGPWMGRFLADLIEGQEDLSLWPKFNGSLLP
ncbi:MAG: FAD-dependent oxidoreductase [Fimbriimonadaceae bacterium]|jgi:sarcosine oxidase|nr:FAD-dependent oxidoreductase [Fimbriimonadaceae bacterium]